MAGAEIIPLGEDVQNEIRRELAKAKLDSAVTSRYFALKVVGATLDDRQMLRMLRYLKRTGSMHREVICQI